MMPKFKNDLSPNNLTYYTLFFLRYIRFFLQKFDFLGSKAVFKKYHKDSSFKIF